MTGEHIRGIPRTYEKEITLADTPYTLSLGYNCVKVDTTGGNVRVNLPNVNYPIDVIKTSSDSYIVTVWVGGVQKATVAGELSKITIENAEVTADEPWYPYDAIVGIAGVSGDGGEVLAKDRYGRVIARGVAGTDDAAVINTAIATGFVVRLGAFPFSLETGIILSSPGTIQGSGIRKTYLIPSDPSIDAITASHATFMCDIHLCDFTVGDGIHTVGHDGIVFDHICQAAIDRVEIYKMGNNGINIDYGWQFKLNGVVASYNNAIGILCGPNVENGLQMSQCGSELSGAENLKILGGVAHSIIGCHFEYGTHGIYASGISESRFIGNKIYSFASGGILISGNACGISDNDIEALKGTPNGIVLYNCIRVNVANNHCYAPNIALLETSDAYSGTLNKFIGNTLAGSVQSVDINNLSASHEIIGNDFRGTPFHVHSDSNHVVYNIGLSSSTIIAAYNVIVGNGGFIARGEPRFVSGSLTAGSADAIAFARRNPEFQDILIKKVTIRITTPGGTAGSLLDVGIADDATGTNLGTEFFDDVDLNTAAIVNSTIATPGTQTVEVLCQDTASATDAYVVGKILVENASSLVGSYYIEYEGA